MVWFFFEILLEAHEHIRKMSANPLFSQRFQGCLYCLIFDFQGSWPAHQRDSHMISASLRTVNKNFALFLFFCSSAGNTIFAVFWTSPSCYRYIDILYSVPFLILSFVIRTFPLGSFGFRCLSQLSFPCRYFPQFYCISSPFDSPSHHLSYSIDSRIPIVSQLPIVPWLFLISRSLLTALSTFISYHISFDSFFYPLSLLFLITPFILYRYSPLLVFPRLFSTLYAPKPAGSILLSDARNFPSKPFFYPYGSFLSFYAPLFVSRFHSLLSFPPPRLAPLTAAC